MDSPDWRAAVARAKRLGIEAYQAGRVKLDASQATTVLVERVTSNEAWGPTSKDCAAIADLTYDSAEAPKVMEVSAHDVTQHSGALSRYALALCARCALARSFALSARCARRSSGGA